MSEFYCTASITTVYYMLVMTPCMYVLPGRLSYLSSASDAGLQMSTPGYRKSRRYSSCCLAKYWHGNTNSSSKFCYPTTNGGMQSGSSVGMCTQTCSMLSRCLLTKFLHRSSVGSLLSVLLVGYGLIPCFTWLTASLPLRYVATDFPKSTRKRQERLRIRMPLRKRWKQ